MRHSSSGNREEIPAAMKLAVAAFALIAPAAMLVAAILHLGELIGGRFRRQAISIVEKQTEPR